MSGDPAQEIRWGFVQEQRALEEEGAEFAREYPEAAQYLDPEKVGDRDPYVERLVDGFAFLSARTRQATMAEEDGLTGHLLELLMGGLEEPLPSVAVAQFEPFRMRQAAHRVERGSIVHPAAESLSDCRFSVSEDVELDHLSLGPVKVEVLDRGEAQLEMTLLWKSARTREAWPDRIRFFLHGDAPVVWSLRYGLTRRAASIQVRKGRGPWEPVASVGFQCHDAPGYAEGASGVSPLADARDFLCADERFRFLELRGLGGIDLAAHPEIALRFRFEGAFPRGMSRAVGPDNFRLHCAVVVNRYLEGCQSLVWGHERSEKVLRPLGPGTREILDISSVEGTTQSYPPRRIHYRRFSAYRHAQSGQRYYQIHRRQDVHGTPLSALALGHPDPRHVFEDEFIHAEAVCCDGNRPHEFVGPLASLECRPGLPQSAYALTLTRPSPIHRPPSKVQPLTRLLAFASGHFQGLMDAARMRDALHQFLWDPSESKRPIVDSLQSITHRTDYEITLGVARSVFHVEIHLRDTTCSPDTWERLGLLDVFASILHRISRDQTPIGSGTRTTVIVEPCGAVLEHLTLS